MRSGDTAAKKLFRTTRLLDCPCNPAEGKDRAIPLLDSIAAAGFEEGAVSWYM